MKRSTAVSEILVFARAFCTPQFYSSATSGNRRLVPSWMAKKSVGCALGVEVITEHCLIPTGRYVTLRICALHIAVGDTDNNVGFVPSMYP